MFYEVFSLSLNVASSKNEYIEEPNHMEQAWTQQSKCAIVASNSTKNSYAKI